ncbi:hypothetical protein B0H17DRAFT_1336400 [Mycena rosella]|uniref:Uncharacterized protein n=1 Tax=Mycena rosella TaxID=1033263 RepID=A0AAD7G4P2_MYCRO|nr:hypothetical protein B0H17DRAFT_1336400 [Mycena rosella]
MAEGGDDKAPPALSVSLVVQSLSPTAGGLLSPHSPAGAPPPFPDVPSSPTHTDDGASIITIPPSPTLSSHSSVHFHNPTSLALRDNKPALRTPSIFLSPVDGRNTHRRKGSNATFPSTSDGTEADHTPRQDEELRRVKANTASVARPFPREEPSDVFWDEDRSDFDGEVDEEFNEALDAVRALHSRKCLALKRLLERAHASSAAQLHALQAELHRLRPQPPPAASSDLECSCTKGYWSGKKAPRAPPPSSATALLGDVPLQKYAVRSHELVGCLAPPLALRILRLLPGGSHTPAEREHEHQQLWEREPLDPRERALHRVNRVLVVRRRRARDPALRPWGDAAAPRIAPPAVERAPAQHEHQPGPLPVDVATQRERGPGASSRLSLSTSKGRLRGAGAARRRRERAHGDAGVGRTHAGVVCIGGG